MVQEMGKEAKKKLFTFVSLEDINSNDIDVKSLVL